MTTLLIRVTIEVRVAYVGLSCTILSSFQRISIHATNLQIVTCKERYVFPDTRSVNITWGACAMATRYQETGSDLRLKEDSLNKELGWTCFSHVHHFRTCSRDMWTAAALPLIGLAQRCFPTSPGFETLHAAPRLSDTFPYGRLWQQLQSNVLYLQHKHLITLFGTVCEMLFTI